MNQDPYLTNKTHSGKTWELKTRITSQNFNNFDFTKTDFNSAIFDKVNFNHCIFDESKLAGSKIFNSSDFDYCLFKNVDLSRTTIGSHKGIYQNCIFEKCNFKGVLFNFTQFINCRFEKCKLINISFNASSFKDCQFIGKLADVSFNGLYDQNQSKYKILDKIDFSEALFGEFVTFYYCDLSTSIPPKGRTFDELLYQIHSNDPGVLSTGSKDRLILDNY
jgi:fluoroquinolone resistance protein